MKIALAADHRGAEVLPRVAQSLEASGFAVQRFQSCQEGSVDYPDVAYPVASAVSRREVDLGVLICGTGIGMCIAANKVPGVRAALVHDEIGADMSRRHNDANLLCLPADLLGVQLIHKIVHKWVRTGFDGGRHARRVRKIEAIERGQDPCSVIDLPSELAG